MVVVMFAPLRNTLNEPRHCGGKFCSPIQEMNIWISIYNTNNYIYTMYMYICYHLFGWIGRKGMATYQDLCDHVFFVCHFGFKDFGCSP